MIAIDLMCQMHWIIEAFACITSFVVVVLGKVKILLGFRAGDVDTQFDLAVYGMVLVMMAVAFE